MNKSVVFQIPEPQFRKKQVIPNDKEIEIQVIVSDLFIVEGIPRGSCIPIRTSIFSSVWDVKIKLFESQEQLDKFDPMNICLFRDNNELPVSNN